MERYLFPPLALITGSSISILDTLKSDMVVIAVVDDCADCTEKLRMLANYAEKVKIFLFIGDNSEEVHDRFDDIIIDCGHLGTLTTFQAGNRYSSLGQALDMATGYSANTIIVTIAESLNREFSMLCDMGSLLAKAAEQGFDQDGWGETE